MVRTVKPRVPRVLKEETKPPKSPAAEVAPNGPDREAFHYHLGQIIAKNATITAHR